VFSHDSSINCTTVYAFDLVEDSRTEKINATQSVNQWRNGALHRARASSKAAGQVNACRGDSKNTRHNVRLASSISLSRSTVRLKSMNSERMCVCFSGPKHDSRG